MRADVVVVGAGIVGLSAATLLRRSGREVLVVTADTVASTTSNVAAAVWFPTAVGPREQVVRWGRTTFDHLTQLARTQPDAGVLERETLMLYREPPGRPWWTEAIDDVADAVPASLPPGYGHGLRFTVPLVVMPVHLRWLADRFLAGGGRMERRRLSALGEVAVDAPVVVDCAGLGARELADDPTVHPLRGQIVRTTNPGLTVSVRDEHHPGGYTYVHPRRDDCILGGTVEADREDTRPDPDTAAAIVARCRALVPELAGATILEHLVGLRPARPTVRLERDLTSVPGTTVIHDYGHGGAGVTLSWGCAEDVVALLDGTVADPNRGRP